MSCILNLRTDSVGYNNVRGERIASRVRAA